ncbi:DUF317 domain-containing protein [Streptacidiphilus rugosus]|uniref:DUF317 domain-containing protein n=1 Tax=Streptacidiphilus rugosus TaxID=405783 RepID=UPI0005668C3A|nr:DUF317 domain-containing protein [Streptacidiphilus rugosus]
MNTTNTTPDAHHPEPALDLALAMVTPRYLAGPGDPNTALDAFDCPSWSWFDDDTGNCHTFSPCQRLYAGFLPESGRLAERTVWRAWARHSRHDPVEWAFRADDHIPAELIAALGHAVAHDWRTSLSGDGASDHQIPGFLSGPGDTDPVWHTVSAHGWVVIGDGEDGRDAFAPDGQARLSYRPRADLEPGHRAWTATARPGLDGHAIWTAHFTARTPTHYLTAFADAFSHPDGLLREPDQTGRHLRQRLARRT